MPRKPKCKKLSDNHLCYMDHLITHDREITNQTIRRRLAEMFKVVVGRETVRNAIAEIGWIKKKTRYCQLIRHANKIKRLVYAYCCLIKQEDFEDCIFSDESSIQLTKNGSLRFRRANELPVCSKVGKPKHPYKVHVWAAISARGASDVCVFTGKLNAAGLELIFKRSLIPFVHSMFPGHHRFIQDNDPKHTSKRIKELMTKNGIHHWRTPPESPDLNPIEMLWADIKRFLTKMKPNNGEELVNGIKEYWATLTPSKCARYIRHLRKTIPLVVLYDGNATGH